jgi:hypothetical protein
MVERLVCSRFLVCKSQIADLFSFTVLTIQCPALRSGRLNVFCVIGFWFLACPVIGFLYLFKRNF